MQHSVRSFSWFLGINAICTIYNSNVLSLIGITSSRGTVLFLLIPFYEVITGRSKIHLFRKRVVKKYLVNVFEAGNARSLFREKELVL